MSRFILSLRCQRAWLFIGVIAAFSWANSPAVHAAPKYGNSLDWVPADAAFYSSSLRWGEQVEIIAHSNAWAKLTNLQAVQMAWQFVQMGINRPGGPADQYREFMAEPENQQLRDLIGDAFSHEVVIYGDQKATDFIDVAQRTFNAMRFSSMSGDATSSPDTGPNDPEMASARTALKALDAHRDRLVTPGIVIGFKLTDTGRAKDQLQRLEKLLESAFEDEPKMKDRLKHTTVGDVDYLTLSLDGSMIPWDEVPWEQLAEEPGQFEKLKAKLEELNIVVYLGVRNDYLLFAIGSSTDQLAQLGKGKLLAELPELQPVEKFAQKPLIGISFASKAFMEVASSANQQIDQVLQTLRQALPRAGLPEETNQRILKDAEEFAADLKAALPQPGAHMGFSFLSDHGIEGYQYDWSKNLDIDGSKPLGLLDHCGGNPLLAYVARGKYSPEQYETLRKWVRKGFGYFEEFAVPEFSADEREKFDKMKEAAEPLVERIDKATGQMLLPGLADSQAALVLDAKITSKQWLASVPQNNRLLPMFEPALVVGVSDPELVRKAFIEYQSVAEAIVEKVKELEPGSIPADYKIPVPQIHDTPAGADYSYKFAKDMGVDPQLAPNGGLGKHVAVLSMVPSQSSQLLADAALNVSPTGPLADRSRPLAAAFYFNWAATVEAVTPWVDLAVRNFSPQGPGAAGIGMFLTDDNSRPELQPQEDDVSAKFVLDQVHTVLDVLKTLRTMESATYLDGGAMVTHSVAEIHDVP
jgi:hypothetical protein